MKTIKNLRTIFSLTFLFLFSTIGSAQDMTQNDPTRQMEIAAQNKVEQWDDHLGLRAKQALLMEKKLMEFAIKREKLMNENISEDEKLNRLKDLKILETREMRDILTQPQFDKYLLILEEEAKGNIPR
ncbi:hypothetical protein [Salinimicrobium terrae]|uniref:hypothetical protein n=1 Tax=Salinimicrobium terrae TaxID=470866 RepID=UPI0004205564|nr:hypothetical protein [Salinimicrobium terrae]